MLRGVSAPDRAVVPKKTSGNEQLSSYNYWFLSLSNACDMRCQKEKGRNGPCGGLGMLGSWEVTLLGGMAWLGEVCHC